MLQVGVCTDILEGLYTARLLCCEVFPCFSWWIITARGRGLTPYGSAGIPGSTDARESLDAQNSCGAAEGQQLLGQWQLVLKPLAIISHRSWWIIKAPLQMSATAPARSPLRPCRAQWPTQTVLLQPGMSLQLTATLKCHSWNQNLVCGSLWGPLQTWHFSSSKMILPGLMCNEGNTHFSPVNKNLNFWVFIPMQRPFWLIFHL